MPYILWHCDTSNSWYGNNLILGKAINMSEYHTHYDVDSLHCYGMSEVCINYGILIINI